MNSEARGVPPVADHPPMAHSEPADSCVATDPDPRAVLIVLMAGTFLAPLDSSIVNIALPSIAAEFGQRLPAVGWIATAYLLTTATLLLSAGRLGDLWGLRKVYVAGFGVFALGSLGCALSGTLAPLIAARVFQAIGASMIFASGPALVTKAFPANRRGYALGMISLSVSAGLTTGPALGGVLVGTFGWQSIFIINIPLAIAVGALAWRLLPDDCPATERFDVPGAVLGGVSLLAILLAFSSVDTHGLASTRVAGLAALAIVSAVAFVYVEKWSQHPMIDLGLFRSRILSSGVAASLMSYASLFTATFTMPFYLVRVHGYDPRIAGLILTTTPLSMALLAPSAGRISDRGGGRGLAVAGLLVLAFGLLALSLLEPDTHWTLICAALFAVGGGMALFQTPNTAAILSATPKHRVGTGSALVGEARNIGMALGIALTAAVITAGLGGRDVLGHAGELGLADRTLFVSAMAGALRVGAGIATLGALLALFGVESKRSVG